MPYRKTWATRCIAAHARGASRAGATKQEVAEAIGVTFLMQGGPATVYGPRAFDAFCGRVDAPAPDSRELRRALRHADVVGLDMEAAQRAELLDALGLCAAREAGARPEDK